MKGELVKESTVKVQVQIYDGRIMSLGDLINDYERLLKKEAKNFMSEPEDDNSISGDDNSIPSKLKVGEWFLIDRDVINKNKEEIRRKCYEEKEYDTDYYTGKELWNDFERFNKIADENPNEYPRLIETYIFENNGKGRTLDKMEDMCKKIGDGMCDEVIHSLELQMRIVYGESVGDLIRKPDKLPRIRIIKLRNGKYAYVGGGIDDIGGHEVPAHFVGIDIYKKGQEKGCTPYAFRGKAS